MTGSPPRTQATFKQSEVCDILIHLWHNCQKFSPHVGHEPSLRDIEIGLLDGDFDFLAGRHLGLRVERQPGLRRRYRILAEGKGIGEQRLAELLLQYEKQ